MANSYLRLGLYDPDPDKTHVRYVGRSYKASGRDMALVAAIIASFRKQTASDPSFRLCLGVFPAKS
jgi:hypothetical protein